MKSIIEASINEELQVVISTADGDLIAPTMKRTEGDFYTRLSNDEYKMSFTIVRDKFGGTKAMFKKGLKYYHMTRSDSEFYIKPLLVEPFLDMGR